MATSAAAPPPSKLNKTLYTDITKLKLLDRDSAEVRFRLQKSPFTGDEDQDELASQNREDYVITGQIFPKSEIFRERSYLTELKLTKTFPGDPPEVRFLTSIYHPNVDKDGLFCNELLHKTATWTPSTSLVQVIKTVVKHVDEPNIDYSMRAEVGKEYQENRTEFDRIARENVIKYGLPR